MATIPKYLTSVSTAGRSPSRRLVAILLAALLALSAISPGLAVAREADSEGEGAGVPVEAPDPHFDPGGEESALEEVPAAGGSEEEEGGAVEVEAEVEAELPAPSEGAPSTGAVPTESSPPAEPEPAVPAVQPEYVPQQASDPAPAVEPVANQSLKAPPMQHQDRVVREVTQESAPTPPESAPAPTPSEEAPRPTPTSAPPATTAPNRDLAGKRVYVVQPGDCLSYIAAALLPAGADAAQIEAEVGRLWRLNADRIGTGDPNLIYSGTELLLH